MLHKVFHFILFLFAAQFAFAQSASEIISSLKTDLTYLADDKLEGRETGTQGGELAADYIAKRFAEIGLMPKGDNGSFFQVFNQKPKGVHGETLSDSVKDVSVKNVLGYIGNGAATTVIIGAHYDHLGFGDESSLNTGVKAIHNGADDNASGTSALLQIAKDLKGKYKNNNYLFIAFSGEEKGLWGSSYYSKNSTIPISTVNYMINMDMVGRLAENKLAIYGTGTSPVWNDLLKTVIPDSIKLTKTESGIGPSDHTSFYLKDIPVLHFFTGQHEDYHKPSDDVDKINFNGIVSVIDFIEKVIAELNDDGKIAFTKTKEEDKANTPAFKVTLGVMPDYMFNGKGMQISAVREGKPAAKAGLLAGDIVIKIGKTDVADMQSYMQALSLYKSGDKVKVVALRNGKKKTMKVVF
ncbi:MAG: M28 family peptidase [Bacteroidia bacterium]